MHLQAVQLRSARQAVHFDHRVQFLAEAERSVRPGSKRVRDPSYFLATCTVLRASVVKILSLHSPINWLTSSPFRRIPG